MTTLILIAGLSFMASVGMAGWQVKRLREGYTSGYEQPSISAVLERGGDHVAFHISTFFNQWVKHLTLQLLMFAKKLVTITKYVIIKVEKHFARVIDLIRGKGVERSNHKRGAVSMFVQEVERFKVEVRSVEDDTK